VRTPKGCANRGGWRIAARAGGIDKGAGPSMDGAMQDDENTFRLRLGRPARDIRPALGQVRAAVRLGGAGGGRPKGLLTREPRAALARIAPSGRHVVVKIRSFAHVQASAANLRAHVAYLARDGTARSANQDIEPSHEPSFGSERLHEDQRALGLNAGSRGAPDPACVFYDGAQAELEGKQRTQAWRYDAQHFRLIISVEDGADLGELRPLVRETLARLEARLGLPLEWLAVDHWDSDHPHAHVLLRGRSAGGRPLEMPLVQISAGLRADAQDIATRLAGPGRVEDRVRAADVSKRRLTSLDRSLLALNVRGALAGLVPDAALLRRLHRLEAWGLAEQAGRGAWRLVVDLPQQLADLSAADEVQHLIAHTAPQLSAAAVLAADGSRHEIGRALALGPSEAGGLIAVIETGRGELRYARFDRAHDLAVLDGVEPGAILAFTPMQARPTSSDEEIARVSMASNGLYAIQLHRAFDPDVAPDRLLASVRRLETMRRSGFVQRRPDGAFVTGGDHLDRAIAFEARLLKRSPVSAVVKSYWPVSDQVEALAPTYLDRALSGEANAPSGDGPLAGAFAKALERRAAFLAGLGFLADGVRGLGQEDVGRLASAELDRVSARLARELALPVATVGLAAIRGIYGRRIDLAQGRFALISGERSAHLVPWRPEMEKFAGRQVVGALRGRTRLWMLSEATLSLPPM
jgi:hypothetical protein